MQLQSLMAQRKLEIHALMFLSMLVELPVYAVGRWDGDDSAERTLLAVYPFHAAAFALLFASFGIYVVQASKIGEGGRCPSFQTVRGAVVRASKIGEGGLVMG